jgi:hypothetical protein
VKKNISKRPFSFSCVRSRERERSRCLSNSAGSLNGKKITRTLITLIPTVDCLILLLEDFHFFFSSPLCSAPSTFSGYLIADCGEAADAIARSQLSSHSSDSRRRREEKNSRKKGGKVVRSREIAERNKKINGREKW